ncbi:serine/threonine-protein kinase [Streptomyces sp. NPDC001732]
MVIADRYELVERLGRGGMGEVWQARDLSLNVDVAVKSVRMAHSQDTIESHRSVLAYARKEAQHAAALRDHPNIVAVHDVVEHEGLPWMVMRLVRGRSVAELLEDEPDGLPVELIDTVARGVLAALAAAHGVGITHRDIKPPNVMVTDSGDVLVTDFGIARHNADTKITKTGSVVGTVAYVAPERLGGVEGPAGDLWSLGVTLYQMATGVSPFDRGSVLATIHAIGHDRPDEPVGAGHLAAVVMALLDKDPRTRPGIDAVLHMLDEARSPARTKVLPRPTADRRRIWLRPALSVASVGAAGLLAFVVASQFREQDPPSDKSSKSASAMSSTRSNTPSPTHTPTATADPTPTAKRSPGPDAESCTAAVQTAANALRLSGIALGDPNRSRAAKARDGGAALRDGAEQISDLADHATETPVKAKLNSIAGDLNAQAAGLDAQLPRVEEGRLVSSKATDLAMKHLQEDVDDLKFLCWK